MRPLAITYRNGWSASMDRSNWVYTVIVRNAFGDVHDKIRLDDYRSAMDYYRAFRAIAKNA